MTAAPGVSVLKKGKHYTVAMDFGVTVRYDGNHFMDIKVIKEWVKDWTDGQRWDLSVATNKQQSFWEREKTQVWALAVTSTCHWLAHFLSVICSYEGLLCGLCGDYDLNSKDDFRKPDGLLAKDANEFGHSWNTDPELVEPSKSFQT